MSSALSNVLNQQCLHVRIWQEDWVFVAECLDIPGCVSEGATREEAIANIDDAMRLCLEVIQEDTEDSPSSIDVEVVERPMAEYRH